RIDIVESFVPVKNPHQGLPNPGLHHDESNCSKLRKTAPLSPRKCREKRRPPLPFCLMPFSPPLPDAIPAVSV
ncbi:MAG: hypothetical protein IKF96_02605, partial [Eggerthellaceae bacterium]|nr:hypothetical protein [Eggerthellaceae bacterium]